MSWERHTHLTIYHASRSQNTSYYSDYYVYVKRLTHACASFAPPYTLENSGIVLGINAITGIIQASEKGPGPSFLPNIQNASDVTVFAPQNSALNSTSIASPRAAANYVVSGPVLYSTALEAGSSILTTGKTKLSVTTDTSGAIFVNGSRIIGSDIITANGVVHVIERYEPSRIKALTKFSCEAHMLCSPF